MCSGSKEGSYLLLTDFLYHSTLGVRVIEKKKDLETMSDSINPTPFSVWRYRGISIMKNSAPIGPYSRTMLRALR